MQGSLLIAAGLSGTPRAHEKLVLDPGDSLVMYSDGLIEHRGELITDGMGRLASAAGIVAQAGWPDRPAVTFASMLNDEERTDDVVVLCLHRDDLEADDVGERISPVQVGRSRVGMAVLELEPVVESTPLARHWVSAHLRDVPPEVASCAGLLTSELVTNAVLHAATPICVTLHVLPDRIRIDVADRSTVIPALKDYGRDAATGRGLTLFNTLASDWGVQATDGGKIVWFELPVDFPVPPVTVSDGAFRFDLAGITQFDNGSEPDAGPPVTVRLYGIPVGMLQKSSEEYEALFRELRLMKERSDVSPSSPALPERLGVLLSGLGTRFSGLGPGMDDVWQGALDRHLDSFDWTLELPQSAAAACEFYDTMLDEADEFAQSARLLTLPASPASVAVRRWFLSEFIRQLRGGSPVAWRDSVQHAELSLPSL
jgi:hypothetical protein